MTTEIDKMHAQSGRLVKEDSTTANAGDLLGTIDADTGNIVTAVQIMDDWDSNDRAKVSPIAGQDGIAAGAGAVGVTVPRVTLAGDDPAVVALQVMDDWDEANRAAVNPIAGQVGVQGGAGANTALTQRVTIATDDEINDDIDAIKTSLESSAGAGLRTTIFAPQAWDGAANNKTITLPANTTRLTMQCLLGATSAPLGYRMMIRVVIEAAGAATAAATMQMVLGHGDFSPDLYLQSDQQYYVYATVCDATLTAQTGQADDYLSCIVEVL